MHAETDLVETGRVLVDSDFLDVCCLDNHQGKACEGVGCHIVQDAEGSAALGHLGAGPLELVLCQGDDVPGDAGLAQHGGCDVLTITHERGGTGPLLSVGADFVSSRDRGKGSDGGGGNIVCLIGSRDSGRYGALVGGDGRGRCRADVWW
jgi:hypothetical protein